jgi:response regulator RpfG family c-di-GMP phosphodiesterase/serine/threonine protein kinase
MSGRCQETPRSAGPLVLEDLLACRLIVPEDWEALPAAARAELRACPDPGALPALLVRYGLVTEYQASRIEAGKSFGLVLGNYRVLDRLGSGGMGVVYRAEHIHLRRQVAVKVVHPILDEEPLLVQRFYGEIRAVARLEHPNVVAAVDVGELHSPDPYCPTLRYFVMEYVPGQNLEELVRAHGPLPVPKACDLIQQIANALAEAHKHGLIHRDIKPSNIQVTPEGQAKLLDFGLARLGSQKVTTPGTALGTIDYMAPEQAQDASAVDIRADLYALGGTLYWCLTGRPPFSVQGSGAGALAQRWTQEPPSLRAARPDAPAGLGTVLARMMAVRPEERFPTPEAAIEALLPYLKPLLRDHSGAAPAAPCERPVPAGAVAGARAHQALIVDDDEDVRLFCRSVLESDTLRCEEAGNGVQALEAVHARPYDLVLLDIDMPQMNGREVLRRLREAPPCPHLKVIMFSGRASSDDMAEMLLAGADDYLTKPFSVVQMLARIKTALRFKDAQDRSDLLNQHLLATNRELEESLSARDCGLVQVRDRLVLALSKLVEYRDSETGQHLVRLQRYCRCLAEEAAKAPPFSAQIDANFVEVLVSCVPLHDIGKAIVPDYILLKPGKLSDEERIIMQRHTVVGRESLAAITVQKGFSPALLQMAIDIVCHHHERYDGTGYPDGLAGTDIPLAARIVAIADVYDALRSRRVYKPALSHAAAVQVLTRGSQGQFDPALLAAFNRCAPRFDQIVRAFPD